jgi:FkbM family methyltransferase
MIRLHLKSHSITGRTVWARIAQRVARSFPNVQLVAICADGTKLVYRQDDATSSFAAREIYDDTLPKALGRLKEGDLFIDIGSNSGVWAMRAAKRVGPKGFVICVEPQIRPFMDLATNAALNGFENIYPLRMAIGNAFGLVELAAPSGHSGAAKIVKAGTGSTTANTKAFVLEGSVLALLVAASERPDPSVAIKIDVEGYEATVLESIDALLKGRNVSFVVLEVCEEHLLRFGSSPQDLYDKMCEAGYVGTVSKRPLKLAQYDEIFVPEA